MYKLNSVTQAVEFYLKSASPHAFTSVLHKMCDNYKYLSLLNTAHNRYIELQNACKTVIYLRGTIARFCLVFSKNAVTGRQFLSSQITSDFL